jgi:hypothetical protein
LLATILGATSRGILRYTNLFDVMDTTSSLTV